MLRSVVLLACIAAAGCSKHPQDETPAATATPPATAANDGAATDAMPAGGRPAWAGRPLNGLDRAALRQYVATAPQVKPSRWSVDWDPKVLAFDSTETQQAIVAIDPTGTRVVLDATAPKARDVKPGRILWLWNLMIREVVSVTEDDGQLMVQVKPVLLTDAMRNADIEFSAPVRLANAIPMVTPRVGATPAAAAALWPPAFENGGRLWFASNESTSPNEEPLDAAAIGGAGTANGATVQGGKNFAGTFKALSNTWDYTLIFEVAPGGAAIDLVVSNSDAGATFTGLRDAHKKAEADAQDAKRIANFEKQREIDQLNRTIRPIEAPYHERLNKLANTKAALAILEANAGAPSEIGAMRRQVMALGEQVEAGKRQMDSMAPLLQKRRKLEEEVSSIPEDGSHWHTEGDLLIAAAAKKLWETAKDNVDVRVHGTARIRDFDVTSLIAISNGDVKSARASFGKMSGHASVQVIGRLGHPGQENLKLPVMELPYALNIPVPVYGIPFVVQLGIGATLTVSLTGLHAVLQVEQAAGYSGGAGFQFGGMTNGSYQNDIGAEKPVIGEFRAMSPGVSAVVVGVQFPRIGFGVGLLGASAVAYFDMVNVLTLTNSASAAIGLAAPPCIHVTAINSGHIGIKTEVLPFNLPLGIGDEFVKDKLSPKMTLWKKGVDATRPPIKACEIG